MSKDQEIVQAFLQELLNVLSEKPALATRLAKVVRQSLRETPLDPLTLLRSHGRQQLVGTLRQQSITVLREIVRYHRIPCSRLSRRNKTDLIAIIAEFSENQLSAHSGSDLQAA